MVIYVILKSMNVRTALIVHTKKIVQKLKEIDKYNIIRFMKSLKQIQEINYCTMKKQLKFMEIEK